jgi:flagellar M-ring protein FliF
MDFLNRAWAQLNDLFKSMTPGARIVAGLLLTVVVVSLVYLFQQHASSPDAYLMGGEPFSAAQLPAMEAAFAKASLTGYEIESNRIRVPRGQQSVYMGALADAGALPPSFGTYLQKAVTSNNPWVGKDQQLETIKVAKQAELQYIICSMKGIESASVLYDVQQKRGFNEQNVVTASVSVKPSGSQALDEERVPALRALVASAIAGLKPEAVTVIDLNGRHYPGGSGIGGSGMVGASSENVYGSWKKAYEQDWQNKIRGALSYIPGVVVTPNVELEVETAHEENKTTYDAKSVVYNQHESTTSKVSKTAAPGGRPGVVPQGGVTQANQPAMLQTAAGPETNEETANVVTANAIPSSTTRISQHGLTPKNVTVQVGIPSTYYEKVWYERNPLVPGQPAKKPDANAITDIETKVKIDVERAVVALLPPVPATVDRFPRVNVTSFQPIAPLAIAGPTLPDKALSWLGQYWTTLGMTGVALFSLILLRGMIQSVPATAPPAPAAAGSPGLSLVTPDEPETSQQTAETSTARSRLKRRGTSGPSLRDELAEIVKEDPDAAVAILRNWIGNAS